MVWGVAGGYWSRFSSFPLSLAAILEYVSQRERTDDVGHNPLAAASVYAMLLFLVLQVASGLFSETKEEFAGPLSSAVSNATVHLMTGVSFDARIKGFDKYAVVVDVNGAEHLVFKHAIAFIETARAGVNTFSTPHS